MCFLESTSVFNIKEGFFFYYYYKNIFFFFFNIKKETCQLSQIKQFLQVISARNKNENHLGEGNYQQCQNRLQPQTRREHKILKSDF